MLSSFSWPYGSSVGGSRVRDALGLGCSTAGLLDPGKGRPRKMRLRSSNASQALAAEALSAADPFGLRT